MSPKLPHLIKVRRRWNDNNVSEVPLEALWDFHFRNDVGGVCGAFPRAFLSAHVWCDRAPPNVLSHVCNKDTAPHDLVACILPSDNTAEVYDSLRIKAMGG
jgi:hypothetical protein